MTDFLGDVIHLILTSIVPTLVIKSMSSNTIDDSELTDDYNFAYVIESHVNVYISELANFWNIPVNHAKLTVTKTTQRGASTCLTPSL